jgi:hypothetical protein
VNLTRKMVVPVTIGGKTFFKPLAGMKLRMMGHTAHSAVAAAAAAAAARHNKVS